MPATANQRNEASRFVQSARTALILAIAQGRSSGAPKPNRFDDSPERLHERIGNWLDLLTRFLRGDRGMRELLSGQTTFEYTAPEAGEDENIAAVSHAIATLRAEILGVAQALRPDLVPVLGAALDEALAGLAVRADHYVETLLIGDCLMVEVGGLAAERTRRSGVAFNAFPINVRTLAQLAAQAQGRKYQAIFFSPFSHARTAELDALFRPGAALWSRRRIDAAVESIIAQTQPLLAWLAANNECPIYVHNAAFIPRADRAFAARAKALLTARQRGIVRVRLNRWLRDFAAIANQRVRNQVQIIDEVAIVRRLGATPASLALHASEFQHATGLSFGIAEDYAERIEMLARLNGRKLVICDLDNTLWDGIIGEGAVAHFADRQRILRRLKDNSGVVLSIASKNDPANVHFTGGVLGPDDFVAPQISWGLKAAAVSKINTTLNLQRRHTVFIDDRPDERALVTEANPDVLALDATDARVWRQIGYWADLVEGVSDLDRTALYRAQAERDSFIEGQGSDVESHLDVAAQLGLEIDVREASGGDLKRSVELVNRTNQWNLCGSRTTLAEMTQLIEQKRGHMLVGRARDRFGDMGDVCVAVVRYGEAGEAEIPIFVLSCRVFGYGVETAVLGEIMRCVDLGGRTVRLIGRYESTAQNQMARNMYTDHGFERQADGSFVLTDVVAADGSKVA